MSDKGKSLCVTVLCTECDGKGTYKILNAYDEDYEEEIECEYCDGCGRTYKIVNTVRSIDLN